MGITQDLAKLFGEPTENERAAPAGTGCGSEKSAAMHSEAASAPRMSPSAAAALEVLRSLPQPVSEDDFRKAVTDGRSVSAAEDPDSRRRAYKRAVQELTRSGTIVFRAGCYSEPDMFDDLPPFDSNRIEVAER